MTVGNLKLAMLKLAEWKKILKNYKLTSSSKNLQRVLRVTIVDLLTHIPSHVQQRIRHAILAEYEVIFRECVAKQSNVGSQSQTKAQVMIVHLATDSVNRTNDNRGKPKMKIALELLSSTPIPRRNPALMRITRMLWRRNRIQRLFNQRSYKLRECRFHC